MQELKVIGIENGALIAVSEDGDRFRVAIDAVMQTKIRQLQSQRASNARVSPRDIQAHIRSGLTREQVAAATGASVEDVERFEGPVLAEREHMLSLALAATVHVAGDDALSHTFGTVIRERLAGLGARDERWACWKDEVQGWTVKVEFTANDVDHDARWAFDARSQSLHPLNSEAITLSQHGDIRGGLIPKLRAVDDTPAEQSRFDSGAFVLDDDGAAELGSALDRFESLPVPLEHSLPSATAAAVKRLDEPAHSPNDTADLLEALRKRRGEREATPAFDPFADTASFGDTGEFQLGGSSAPASDEHPPVSIWAPDTMSADVSTEDNSAPIAELNDAPKRRSGRTSLPSWDEIVFGARSDEDPA